MTALANLRLHVENIVDGAVLAASTEQAAYPASNLKHPFRKRSWRATDGQTAVLTIDAGAPYFASAVCIVNCNLLVGSFRVTAADEATFAAPLLDETFAARVSLFGFGHTPFGAHQFGGYLDAAAAAEFSPDATRVHYFSAGIFARYWRIELSEPAESGLAHIELGRLILGGYLEPSRNVRLGAKLIPIDESAEAHTEGGQRYVDRRPKRRALALEFSPLTPVETLWQFFDWLYRIGKRQSFMAVLFGEGWPADLRHFTTIYGHLKGDLPGVAFGKIHNQLTGPVEIRESL